MVVVGCQWFAKCFPLVVQTKIIDDQSATLRGLRQTVADKEREVSGLQEEMR